MTGQPAQILEAQGDFCETGCLHPEAVGRARQALPEDGCVEGASALLKVVADPTRLRLLAALGTEKLCVHDLSRVVGVSPSATSHQLRLLRAHRLVSSRKVGRTVYYHLADEHVSRLIAGVLAHVGEG